MVTYICSFHTKLMRNRAFCSITQGIAPGTGTVCHAAITRALHCATAAVNKINCQSDGISMLGLNHTKKSHKPA